MSGAQVEIQILAVVVAVACALPGVFLVLRRLALMADAIGHAMLFGIVIAFFVTHDIASPLLILAAALTGLLTVSLVELLTKTRLVKEDAAIGLVFPALFAAAVVLISRYAGDVHLDTDAVLLGRSHSRRSGARRSSDWTSPRRSSSCRSFCRRTWRFSRCSTRR